jgi:hypothetical protein
MTSVNALFKAYIDSMPDILNTKKDVDEYCKQFWKEQKEKIKEAKAAEKAAKVINIEKPKRKKRLDEDGNVKEKRAPSAYNIFVKEKYAEIKEENPDMDKTKIFEELAKLWNIRKREQNENVVPEANPDADVEPEADAKPDADVEPEAEAKPDADVEPEADDDIKPAGEIVEVKNEDKIKKKAGRKNIKKKDMPDEEINQED